jgi:hypothetical protein
MAWVSIISMGVGFFAWYQGLATGGVARVGRLQLAQPALTLVWAALLLGEHVSVLTAAAAAAVIVVTAAGRNAGTSPARDPGPAASPDPAAGPDPAGAGSVAGPARVAAGPG